MDFSELHKTLIILHINVGIVYQMTSLEGKCTVATFGFQPLIQSIDFS